MGTEKTRAQMKTELIQRLNDNFTDYFNALRGLDEKEIIGMSAKIGATASAHYYLTASHHFQADELEYLLKFRDPLRVVADEFLPNGLEENSDIMWEICNRQDTLQGEYELMPGVTAHDYADEYDYEDEDEFEL